MCQCSCDMYDITSLRRCPVVNRSLGIIRQYRDVEHTRQSRFDSWVRRGVFQKKTGTFTLRCKELTRDFDYFERSISTKNRLILIQNRELQIILKNLENFIKRLNSYFFDFKKRIQYITGDRCDDALDSTEVRIEDVS